MTLVKQVKVWDTIVVGGGPAGMMAAIQAGSQGLSVLLIEKNTNLGKKLLITGGGRCNVTNNKPVVRDMLSQYKEAGKFLFSTFMQHGVAETTEFFAENGLKFTEENEGRLFPITNKAESVFQVLKKALAISQVSVQTNSPVKNITKNKNYFLVEVAKGISHQAKSVVLAVGGTARPETGSTGDAWPWLTALGHTVEKSSATLVPLTVKDTWITKLGGVNLPSAQIAIYCSGRKRHTATGKLLFTHTGLSGPLILNQSKMIGELLLEGEVVVKIDVVPTIDAAIVQAKLLESCLQTPNKMIKNVLAELIKPALVGPLLLSLRIDGDTVVHSLKASDRKRIGVTIKAFPFIISGLLGTDKAVATAGGVALKEIDFKTMESRLVPGLYLVGDVLNINRPSGGYSLQLCWSTGAVAGQQIKKRQSECFL